MNSVNAEVMVQNDFETMTWKIWFIQRNSTNNKITCAAQEKDGWLFTTYNPSEKIPPTFTIPRQWVKAFMKGMEDSDMPKPSKDRTEGELEATKYHLSDLRKILTIKEDN